MNNQLIRGNLFLLSKTESQSRHFEKGELSFRMDGTVLINRDIFEEYLERFHEPSTLKSEEEPV